MKKTKFAILLTAVLAFTVILASCVPAQENTLTVSDVKVYLNGDAVSLNPTFSGKTEAISYEYDESALEILNGKVKGLKEGEFQVTAKSKSCETAFTVTCVLPLKIADLYAWVNYPASDISPVVNVDGDAKVKYTTTSDIISIEGNYVTALKTGNAEVTAEIDGYTTTFAVTCRAVDRSDPKYYYVFPNGADWGWRQKAQQRRAEYNQKGTDGKTTVFIGDSFFDIDFFSSFYSFYPSSTYDALCHGIGGTTSNTWEMMLDDYFDGINPKNAVVQLGNNNYYNDGATVDEIAEDLQRFLTYMHGKMPNTQIYYFAITPRRTAMELQSTQVKQINKKMGEYCAAKDWVVFLDTTEQMTSDLNWTADNVHPKPEKYQIFVDALAEAGMTVENK